jgi:hypothetical protein
VIVTRSLRRIAAWLALAAMLFAQACLAAYACPVVPVKATVSAEASECHGESHPQPDAPCDTHCQGASATLSAAQVPTVAILASAPLVVAARDVVLSANCWTAGDEVATNANAPPAAIRYCRFLN